MYTVIDATHHLDTEAMNALPTTDHLLPTVHVSESGVMPRGLQFLKDVAMGSQPNRCWVHHGVVRLHCFVKNINSIWSSPTFIALVGAGVFKIIIKFVVVCLQSFPSCQHVSSLLASTTGLRCGRIWCVINTFYPCKNRMYRACTCG